MLIKEFRWPRFYKSHSWSWSWNEPVSKSSTSWKRPNRNHLKTYRIRQSRGYSGILRCNYAPRHTVKINIRCLSSKLDTADLAKDTSHSIIDSHFAILHRRFTCE